MKYRISYETGDGKEKSIDLKANGDCFDLKDFANALIEEIRNTPVETVLEMRVTDVHSVKEEEPEPVAFIQYIRSNIREILVHPDEYISPDKDDILLLKAIHDEDVTPLYFGVEEEEDGSKEYYLYVEDDYTCKYYYSEPGSLLKLYEKILSRLKRNEWY